MAIVGEESGGCTGFVTEPSSRRGLRATDQSVGPDGPRGLRPGSPEGRSSGPPTVSTWRRFGSCRPGRRARAARADPSGRHRRAQAIRIQPASPGTVPRRSRGRRAARTDSPRKIRPARGPCSRRSTIRSSRSKGRRCARELVRDVCRLRERVRADAGPPRRRRSAARRVLPLRLGRQDQPEPPEPQVAVLPAHLLDRVPEIDALPRTFRSRGRTGSGSCPTSRSHWPCVISYFEMKNGSSVTSVTGDSSVERVGIDVRVRRRLIVVRLDRAHPERPAGKQHEHEPHRLGQDELPSASALGIGSVPGAVV